MGSLPEEQIQGLSEDHGIQDHGTSIQLPSSSEALNQKHMVYLLSVRFLLLFTEVSIMQVGVCCAVHEWHAATPPPSTNLSSKSNVYYCIPSLQPRSFGNVRFLQSGSKCCIFLFLSSNIRAPPRRGCWSLNPQS